VGIVKEAGSTCGLGGNYYERGRLIHHAGGSDQRPKADEATPSKQITEIGSNGHKGSEYPGGQCGSKRLFCAGKLLHVAADA
jgi:hypothetical protein